jgi:G3E family GTPase
MVTSFSILQSMFFYVPSKSNPEDEYLCDLCKIQKVINIVDIAKFEAILGKVGSPLIEQMANSDIVMARNMNKEFTSIKRTIHNINKGVKIYPLKSIKKIDNLVYKLSSGFSAKFIVKLITFFICFSTVAIFFSTGLGGYLL